MDKLKIARRELGMATSLWLLNKDPVSIHLLACAASELLRGICKTEKIKSFAAMTIESQIIIEGQLVDDKTFIKVHNLAYNAVKHWFKDHQTGEVRDDSTINIADEDNDAILFQAWYDYGLLTLGLPIEAQVFQSWYLQRNRMKNLSLKMLEKIPELKELSYIQISRNEIKKKISSISEKLKADAEILSDFQTEKEPLEFIEL